MAPLEAEEIFLWWLSSLSVRRRRIETTNRVNRVEPRESNSRPVFGRVLF